MSLSYLEFLKKTTGKLYIPLNTNRINQSYQNTVIQIVKFVILTIELLDMYNLIRKITRFKDFQ